MARNLLIKFRGLKEDEYPRMISKENFVENCPLSEAFAINRLITAIGMGICGDNEAYSNAYMRTNVLKTCQWVLCSRN